MLSQHPLGAARRARRARRVRRDLSVEQVEQVEQVEYKGARRARPAWSGVACKVYRARYLRRVFYYYIDSAELR